MRPRARVRKAVFPVAGFGVRFLPATKACPKEMLPVVDRPLIQYAVEEAAAAGIRDMIFITGRNKRAIEDHFDKAYELERELTASANERALAALRSVIPPGVRFSYVRQPVVAGVGDALLRARALTGDEPFAMLLPDDLIDGERPALSELLEVFEDEGASVVAVQAAEPHAPREDGIVVDETDGSVRRVDESGVNGVSRAAYLLVGRAIFTPGIWTAVAAARADGSAATLPRAVAELCARERVFTCEPTGRRYDCGTQIGYLEAQLAYARKRPELWPELRESLASLVDATIATGRRARRGRRSDGTFASAG
jgi:UTP--glucose-1-phosphate uridylyltransferase